MKTSLYVVRVLIFVMYLSDKHITKIGTRGVHVSTDRGSKMCYSLGTSVGDVTRLNVANVVRFSLYI